MMKIIKLAANKTAGATSELPIDSKKLHCLSIQNGNGEYISHSVLKALISEKRNLQIQNEKFRRSLEYIAAGHIAPLGSYEEWRRNTMRRAKETLQEIHK